MNKIDIHADDYGITIYASEKILELVNMGKLTGVSVMPNMSIFDEAVELWKAKLIANRDPLISVHLNFMEGHSVSNPDYLSYLVNKKGFFNISWGTLVKYNYDYRIRGEVKSQLKREIKEQIDKVIRAYHLLEGKQLRIDSHQHTHMIPLVMESLLEVIRENNYPVEYIRISKEPWIVYLKHPQFYYTYRIINIIKVAVLNYYAYKNQKMLKVNGIPSMLLSGVFLSGKMDKDRIEVLYPKLKKYAQRKNVFLELLFHPGGILPEEIGEDFNQPKATEFYLSNNRKIEGDTLKSIVMD